MYNYAMLDETAVEFVDVGKADELPSGERIFVEAGGLQIVIFNIGGQLYAIGDVCSHDDGPVGEGELDNLAITCPRHGAQFDVRNGRVLQMPAAVDIPAYPVRVVQGIMQLGLPRN
jgi:3-phenylpropionate/trans-cinnamate dioxygenase ferredoxin subunit